VKRTSCGGKNRHGHSPSLVDRSNDPATTLAAEFGKSHGKRVEELMFRDVVTATEDTLLPETATSWNVTESIEFRSYGEASWSAL
jgi:hypothetical protein